MELDNFLYLAGLGLVPAVSLFFSLKYGLKELKEATKEAKEATKEVQTKLDSFEEKLQQEMAQSSTAIAGTDNKIAQLLQLASQDGKIGNNEVLASLKTQETLLRESLGKYDNTTQEMLKALQEMNGSLKQNLDWTKEVFNQLSNRRARND